MLGLGMGPLLRMGWTWGCMTECNEAVCRAAPTRAHAATESAMARAVLQCIRGSVGLTQDTAGTQTDIVKQDRLADRLY